MYIHIKNASVVVPKRVHSDFFFKFYVCVHMCACVWVCACLCICVCICECLIFVCRGCMCTCVCKMRMVLCTCKGQRGNKASSSVTSSLILEVGLQLANPSDPPVSCPTTLGLQLHVAMPGFVYGCWGFELWFTCYAANACAHWVKSLVLKEYFW